MIALTLPGGGVFGGTPKPPPPPPPPPPPVPIPDANDPALRMVRKKTVGMAQGRSGRLSTFLSGGSDSGASDSDKVG